MSSLQGAKVIGADTRCDDDQVSSLSAFLRVAKQTDNIDDLYLDIIVESTPEYIDPIDIVQDEYNSFMYGVNLFEIKDVKSKLIKMIDILGREKKVHKKGTLLFFIYQNGKVKKRIIY